MKVIIDGRMLKWTGVGRYTYHLLDQLQKLDSTNLYDVLVLSKDRGVWEPSSGNFSLVEVDAPPYHPTKEQWRLAQTIKKLQPDLVHFTSINRPAFYRGPNITTVHDLNMLDPSQITAWYKSYKWLGVKFVTQQVIKTTSRLIVPSEGIRDEIAHTFPAVQDKVKVIYEAGETLSNNPRVLPALRGIDFIAYVGNGLPNKNLPRLLEGFTNLVKLQPSVKLALVGNLGTVRGPLVNQSRELGLTNKVVFTNFIPDSNLAWVYAHAKLIVLPSLSEGFGLQVLEAFAANTPVVAAENGVYPEIAGKAAIYFNPHNPDEMAAAMNKVLKDPQLGHHLRQLGSQRLKKFSWRKMAEQTLSLYQKVV